MQYQDIILKFKLNHRLKQINILRIMEKIKKNNSEILF